MDAMLCRRSLSQSNSVRIQESLDPQKTALRSGRGRRVLKCGWYIDLALACSLGLALIAASPPVAAENLSGSLESILDDPAALLRAASESAQRKAFAEADQLYGQLAERHPIVGDYAALHRARLQLSEGFAAKARRIATRAQADFPRSLLRAELFELIGEAFRSEGDEAGGRKAWAAALAETRNDDARASLLRRIARSQARSGQRSEAGITWRLIWYAHPATDVAKEASERLDQIEAQLGQSLRRASDWRRRGDRFFRLRKNPEALEAYQTALTLDLSKNEARRTHAQRARSLFRLRRYPESVQAFAETDLSGDLPIWHARSLARADRVPESIAALEKLAVQPGPNRSRAHYLAALLLSGREHHQRAQVHFEAVVAAGDWTEDAWSARWFLAWREYREGRYARAADQFESLTAVTQDELEGLRPLYWQARSLAAAGQLGAAEKIYADLARNFPLSYYGWRARDRVRTNGGPLPTARLAMGRVGLRPSQLARPRILIAAGMLEAGAKEGVRLIPLAAGLEDRRALASLLTSAGDFYHAQRLIVDAYSVLLARAPADGLEEIWRYAWPSAYSALVETATGNEEGVRAELVYAIMREESGYRPKIVSPVGARGLLQIMDETGQRLADRIGWADFDVEALFDPATNIALGSHYLGELSGRFPTRMAAVIASYNAGPQVVSHWLTEDPRSDQEDEWVESIPYAETRGYVKRVLRSLQAYQRLY